MMLRLLPVLLLLLATPSIPYAQEAACEDPARYCSRELNRNCLGRVGAGSVAVQETQITDVDTDCEAQLTQYRECLGMILTQCDGAERQATAPTQNQCTPFREQTLYEAALTDPSKLEMLAQTCPESPLIALLQEQQDTLTQEQIRAAQTDLSRLKLYYGPIDGVWNDNAEAALQAFERHSGLQATGELTETSLTGLRAAKAPPEPLRGTDPATLGPGEIFQECDACPVMVVAPAGSFMMGSATSETGRHDKEGPRRRVEVERFALGRTEVTLQQWRQFLEATGYAERLCSVSIIEGDRIYVRTLNVAKGSPLGLDQPDIYPAGCISGEDASEYVNWLNQQVTGAPYRIPSEAEWEYAARAGSGGEYAWGSYADAGCDHANTADQSSTEQFPGIGGGLACDDGHPVLAPVGMYRPNAFGFYDMLGNLSEVTQDCLHENYENAPSDGSAWMEEEDGKCYDAVLRGGSWVGDPFWLRSASRMGTSRTQRQGQDGLRVARTLPEQ